MKSVIKFFKGFTLRKEGQNQRDDRLYFWFLVLIYLVFILSGRLYPPDDFWRHLISNKYDFNYQNLYFNSDVPQANFWLGFDYILSWIHPFLGQYSYIPIQVLVFLFYTIGFYLAFKNKNINNYGTLLFFYVLFLCMLRVPFARPSVLAASLFFLLWFWENRFARVLIPLIAAPLYWLFFIAFTPLILKERFTIISLAGGLIFWIFYAGDEYFTRIVEVFLLSTNRGSVVVPENLSIVNIFLSFHVLSLTPIILLLAYEGISLKELIKTDIKTFIAIIFFCLSNQIRYFSDFVSPLLYSYSRYLKHVKLYKILVVTTFFFPIFIWTTVSKTDVPYSSWQKFDFLKGSKVLVANMPLNFPISYFVYPVKIVPPMEYGWTDTKIQSLIKSIRVDKKFNCSLLSNIDIEYIIESSVEKVSTEEKNFSCVELVGLNGKYRIWKVKNL